MIAAFPIDFGMPAKAEAVAYVSICVDFLYTTEQSASQKNKLA